MIDAEGLTRRYGETLAVDSVSFSIGSGEIVGLLGHNGAGKTTIMKMLTGYLEPSGGRALVDGVDVATEPEAVQARLGYLPENCPVYPEMAIVDYLDYVAGLRGVPQRPAALRKVLAATDLADRALDGIGTLSRGYQQRVGVAQAIVHAPQVLILDEPTSGLDPSQTEQMRELIRRLAEKATVILSTHIMQEVDAVCDRVMILRAGELAVDERLATLKESTRVTLATDAGQDAVAAAVGDFATVAAQGPSAGEAERFAFEFPNGNGATADGVAELARRLVAGGVSIHGLAAEKRDLETVFREVNAAAVADAADAASEPKEPKGRRQKGKKPEGTRKSQKKEASDEN